MNSGDPEARDPGRNPVQTDPLEAWSTALSASRLIAACIHDRAGRIADANPAFCRLVGRAREEIVGTSLETLVGADGCRRLLTGPDGGRRSEQLTLKRVDGESVRVELEFIPAHGDRAPSGLVGIIARECIDDRLHTGEETARVLLSAAADAAFLLDTEGTVLAANRPACDHLGSDTVVGRPLSGFLPPAAAELHRQKELAAIRSGRPLEFEDECLGRSCRISIHPVCDPAGKVIRLAVYCTDNTVDKQNAEEHRKLTQQLQQAQKMEAIGTLAGGIAHDFNNLLMAIQGNVSLVLFDLEPADPRHRLLTNIEKLIGSGAELTSKLLGYARRGKYESKPLQLNDLVRETSDTFGRMRKDITIHRNLADDLRPIVADRGQLEQVMLNLFVNAADAMPNGGDIQLKTRNVTHQDIPARGYKILSGNYVRLAVQDSGVGMDPEVMARIFDPFFTTKRMGRGTGLGLASAYGIVKGHGGYIDVESEKGHGSIFYVFLPATSQTATTRVEPTRKIEPGAGTLLLVDDELTVLEVTAAMLERLGYTVVMAASGHEALTIFRQNPARFRLVILDMIMPQMGGGEVFDRLKHIRPDVKVLLASGYSMQGQAREIMNRGCTGFIQKPFTMEDLSLKLQAALK